MRNLKILKISDIDVVSVLLFDNKGFTRDVNLKLLNLQYVSLKIAKDLMNNFLFDICLSNMVSGI